MERVERFADLAPLLSAQLRKGVFTNNFLRPEDYDREIARGLRVHAYPGGLLLLRARGSHDVLNFYLQRDGALELPTLDRPVVTELVWRPREAEAAAAALARFRAAGFAEQFRRLRRERPDAAGPDPADACSADPARAGEVLDFLRAHFDPFTGCLPTEEELAAGHVVCTADRRGLTGVLHFSRGRASTEIRHLAVRADCRGRGLAGALLGAYLQAAGGGKSQVWARQGNGPAEHFYEKHQYRPDGWQSAVLLAGGKEQL